MQNDLAPCACLMYNVDFNDGYVGLFCLTNSFLGFTSNRNLFMGFDFLDWLLHFIIHLTRWVCMFFFLY